ncbi:MAG: hypothetical protein MUD16_15255 [Desulfobacterales bacterium]|nr:hypothetical protein [Desulfobacterales bacterium]
MDALRRRHAAIEARFPQLVGPESPAKRVGAAPAEGFQKVPHRVPMLSLGNAFAAEEVSDWLEGIRNFLRELQDPAARMGGAGGDLGPKPLRGHPSRPPAVPLRSATATTGGGSSGCRPRPPASGGGSRPSVGRPSGFKSARTTPGATSITWPTALRAFISVLRIGMQQPSGLFEMDPPAPETN